ncbi:MAG: biotin--[acetyl-CoA-carboxylase] ligase [Paracoccaceae bacterium]
MCADQVLNWPEGVSRHVLAEVDSTNAEALRLAPGLSHPAWIMARRQTAGRGRRGRPWVNPAGNFSATLLMQHSGTPLAAAQLSFVAALALHDSLTELCGAGAEIGLKWPNDVLLNGGKVAGILLENAQQGLGPSAIAIGIGVNLCQAPVSADLPEPGTTRPVSILGETGLRISQDQMLDHLAPAFARYGAQWALDGFAPIRTAWLEKATRLGQEITARTMTETITGIFARLDGDGSLVLQTGTGERVISAADIYF